jgi:hypothetical protein
MPDLDDSRSQPVPSGHQEIDILRRTLAERLPYTSELLTGDQKEAYIDVLVALHRLVISLSD